MTGTQIQLPEPLFRYLRVPFSVLGSKAHAIGAIKVEAFGEEFREGRGILGTRGKFGEAVTQCHGDDLFGRVSPGRVNDGNETHEAGGRAPEEINMAIRKHDTFSP